MELTSEDLARAHELGMDDEETSHNAGTRPATLYAAELWKAAMGTASRTDYPADAVSQLRDSYDHGRVDFY
jgi:hypothetical protein